MCSSLCTFVHYIIHVVVSMHQRSSRQPHAYQRYAPAHTLPFHATNQPYNVHLAPQCYTPYVHDLCPRFRAYVRYEIP
ncbi:hypothetical protein Pmani_008496 [Petrolisthes manimaculis]|uniref:Uncharacterized protein n=1 Tax=Petrolisthes manimaculis TaxID=1843537 RepID=A0AAE1Q679_9EUCA|nr:hypothetical protein Pmani_008496 [Petrolisthes manimaculis]